MTVCYGCLYDYTRKDNGPSELALVGRPAASADRSGVCEVRAGDRAEGAAVAAMPAAESSAKPSPVDSPESPAAAADGASAPFSAPPAPQAIAGHVPPSAVSVMTADFDDEVTTVLDAPPAGERAHAVWVKAAGADVLVPLDDAGISVGRGSGNTVVLHDKSVSRRHLCIAAAEGGAEVRDLGSTNPARYRGRPLRQSVLVRWGEEVELGGAVLAMCE